MAISYDDSSGIDTSDGTGKAEHYDVALCLEGTSLKGKSIVGVRIPFNSIDNISGLKVWMSSKLELSDEDNMPICDILEKSVDLSKGWIDVKFDSPIIIDDVNLYIGYSFDVDKIDSNNLKPICLTSVVSSQGYYIHTTRSTKYKKWTNANEKSEVGSLRMQVMVKGMDANAASIEIYPKINVQLGAIASVPVRITCHGYNGVSSIDYDYDVNGKKGHGFFVLESPIPSIYNKYADINIPLCEITETGQLPFSVDVVKVNDGINTDVVTSSEGMLNVFDFVPVHRPLFEEYTGAWCGNCPRGLAAIEAMKELYGDEFICISYHNADAMEITTSFPSEIRGFPDSWISRKKRTDPFFGDKNDGQFHLPEEWEVIKKEPTTISVDVEANWADADESQIDVSVKIMSQIHYSSEDIAIGCALIADELNGSGTSWNQTNYYSGTSETCAPELKWIAELPKTIKDFHFNDVLILGKNLDGMEANMPFEIEPMNEYEVNFSLNLNDAVNTSGENLVQDKSKLRVVALGIDRNSAVILNSNQTNWMETSGIKTLYTDLDILKIEYFDLLGNRKRAETKGLFLKVVSFKDGSRECVKVMNR